MPTTESAHVVKTRLAPTPSGYLHIGNAYNFILTWLLGRLNHGSIRLRIDDLDRDRIRTEYLYDIFNQLHWLGLEWDEGPQSPETHLSQFATIHRFPHYHQALESLRLSNHLYACTCSRNTVALCSCSDKEIPFDTPECSWNLRIPPNRMISFQDLKLGRVEASLSEWMPRLVLRKKNGDPAYQIASLCDDEAYATSLLVRGEDLLPSTLVQRYLAECLNFCALKNSTFLHHGLLPDEKGNKLSKSAGSTSLQYLKRTGARPDALFKMVAGRLQLPPCSNARELLEAASIQGMKNLSFRDV